MRLLGLPVATLLYLGAAMAVAVVGLYLLKLRRRRLTVPFAPLWQQLLRQEEASRLISRFKRVVSLLLHLMLAGLLVLALGEPISESQWREGRSIVVLVDVSASMSAVNTGRSRLDQARSNIERLAKSVSVSDQVLVAELGATPRPLTSFTRERKELERAASQLKVLDVAANLEAGIRFAQQALDGRANPELILLSDGALLPTKPEPEEPRGSENPESQEAARLRAIVGELPVTHVLLGSPAPNIGITEFSVRRYPLDPSRAEALLELTNASEAPASIELTLLGDGSVIDVVQLKLQAAEVLNRFYPNVSGVSERLEVRAKRLDGEDAVPRDNRGYALLPKRKRQEVLLVSPGNTYLEAALLLDDFLIVTQVSPGEAMPAGPFDVTVLDGVAPPLTPSHGARIYLNPPKEGPVELVRSIEDFGFDSWDQKSPFLRWMSMENIQVTRGFALKKAPGDRVLGSSEQGNILLQGSREGAPFLAVGFDPRDSDFVLRVGWPLFVLNAITQFGEGPDGYRSSFRTGEVWMPTVPAELNKVFVSRDVGVSEKPDRLEVPVLQGRAVIEGQLAGYYELTDPSGGVVSRFAANLAQREETVREGPLEPLLLGKQKKTDALELAEQRALPNWLLLLLVLGAVSVLEWASYHRRLTV